MSSLKFKCGLILGILLISGNLVFSQWQQHSINCYTCEGDACVNQLGNVNACSGDNKQSCVTVFSEDATSVKARGCSEQIAVNHASYCDSHSDKCLICTSNSCNSVKNFSFVNSEVFAEDVMSCHKCNSLDNPNCQDKPDSSVICSENSPNEVCYTKLVNDVTYRGCSSDFTCDDTDKQYCKMCNTTNCNVANLYQNNIGYPGNWQDLPINCYTCFGAECDNTSTTLLRKCEDNNLQNCVTVFSMAGKVAQRGCSDVIYDSYYDHHCDNHPELCTYCKSSGCNNAQSIDEYVDCLFCDSTTNPNCTSNAAGVSRTRKCKSKCMTALYPRTDEPNPALELSRTCPDDKELDDRTECEKGNDKYCQICQGDSCNDKQLPENRLSCLRCVGDGCVDPVPTKCPAYRENDKCYILFEEYTSVAQMGCKSDFDNATLNALRKKMLFCEGNDCNGFEIMPVPRQCLECNSAEDPLCATKPDDLTSFKQCNQLPYSECYTRIEDGHTIRGCMADMEMETIDMCKENGDNVLCNVCTSERCNKGIYPEARQLCYRCSSDDDEFCQSEPYLSSACPIYQTDEQCAVAIFGDTTQRGCRSEIGCDATDRETCRLCAANNCNTIDLLSNYIGKPGQWQDLPLNCYTCEGSGCQNSIGSLKMCDNNNLQKCETVFDSTEAVISRGCSDYIAEEHGDYCDTHSGYCQQCKSSGCNNVTKFSDYLDCVFCDSATDPDCVLSPDEIKKTRKCNQQCMVALFPRTSEEDPSYEMSRSCLDDKDLDDRENCAEPYCKACSGPSCNKFEFPTGRHECWSCRDDCVNPNIQKCVSYHPKDQCYILFDNTSTTIAMGCRSEYEHSTVTELVQAKKLLLCNGTNCNSHEIIPSPQSCLVCDSAVNPLCATNPNLITDYATCSQLPYTGCYTWIDKDGNTVRGCQSTLSGTTFYGCYNQSDSACSTCNGTNCNNEIFPENRHKCQRCNSLDDGEKCATSPESNGVCPKLTDDQTCVTTYKNGVTYRGCASELSCDVSDKKNCRICTGPGCNTVNLEHVAKDGEPGKWQDLPIKCHTCKDETCKNSVVPVEVCSNNNLQNCVTVFGTDGEVIQRGCSDSVEEDQEIYCEQNNNKCFRCNSNECNKATKLDEYVKCLSCDTSTNSSCVKDPDSLKDTRMCFKGCMTALYPKSAEDDPAYETIRTCLDDKELADQLTCSAGTEDMCKSCETEKCNKANIPGERQRCYHCSGDDCQLPKSELCSGYRANDQCSILLDHNDNIIGAGCKSDFTIDQTVALIKAKRLLLCNGTDCNDIQSLPPSQICSLCNSRTDPNCAINPDAVQSNTQCNQKLYTDCYSRVLSDGSTERGCLSNLIDNEFYDCLIGNSTTCTKCKGNNCNAVIYPAGRKSCHICDTGSDPYKCEANPDSSSICPKYDKNDVCVTQFTAGITYRGCRSDIQCNSSDRKRCRVCDADNCNTVNLAIKQDDNYGKWQDLPLECFECKDNQCDGPLGETKKCQDNNEQDCSTVFSNEGKVIRRGCSDEIDEEFEAYCDTNSGRCFNCKSNACNNATLLTEFNNCVYCDSNKDKNCITNANSTLLSTRQCHGNCMTALYPSDSSSNPAYDLIRTCLNDKEPTDQTNCKEPLCQACQGDSCNKHNLPANRLSCHTCLNGSCENPVPELCPLYKEDDQCFIRFDTSNTIAEMGCLSAFRNQELIDILKTKKVYICENENCNSLDKLPEPQKCISCDSANDLNCAIDANQIGSVEICNILPYPNCYTKIAAGGTTHRGCLNDLSADEFASCILSGGDNCTHCVGPVCNRDIFPESRLKCYSCDSETDPDCEELPTKTSVCPYVRDNEKCVTALGGNRTERGCSSQLLCDTNDKSTCRHCSFSGCNTLDLMHRKDDDNHGMWQELPLKCYNCTGEGCESSLGIAVVCKDGDQQDCMTVFDEQGKVVRRGCTFDVEDERDLYCRQNPDKCISCKSNECNHAWEINELETCAYCNSATNPSCVTRPLSGTFATRKCRGGCMAALYKAENGTTQVIRTCLDDKETEAQHQCSAEFESSSDCSSCIGNSCNLFNYPKDRLMCHVCTDPNCVSTIEEYCAAYVNGDKCFAKYKNDKVELSGCSSDIDNSIIEEWKEKNQLYVCSEENCNKPENLPTDQTCVACDSSKTSECATNPLGVNETLRCSAPINSCMMNVTGQVTHRGCLNSLPYSKQNECSDGSTTGGLLCGKCSGNKCNNMLFPSDRRSCYICKSDKDNDCISDPKKLSVCPNYTTDNLCVTKYKDGITERGCSTELTCGSDSTSDNCQYCNKDGCNTVQLDNGVGITVANNLLLTLLVAIVSLIGLTGNYM